MSKSEVRVIGCPIAPKPIPEHLSSEIRKNLREALRELPLRVCGPKIRLGARCNINIHGWQELTPEQVAKAQQIIDQTLLPFSSTAKQLGFWPADTVELFFRSLPDCNPPSPATLRDTIRQTLARQNREVFGCLWLDAQGTILANDLLFAGTISQVTVYPRELARVAILRNAAACLMFHNHLTTDPEPTDEDRALTTRLTAFLRDIDVTVLDHVIVARDHSMTSFAESGLL